MSLCRKLKMFCGVVIQGRRLFLNVGVGRVGVGRRGQQVGIDAAGRDYGRRRRVGDRPGVERGKCLRARVELHGQVAA